MLRLLMFLLSLNVGCAHTGRGVVGGVAGPAQVTVPVYRNPVSADKLFVEVRLHDGTPRLFLLDTGSALSMVSRDVALELGVPLRPRSSTLVGIAGATSWVGTTLPELRIGRLSLREQDVAVGIKGVPTHVGLVPLDGILGNDVLKHFRVELDYPAQSMTLARDDESGGDGVSVPLFFDGQHAKVQVQLTARNEEGRTVHQPALLDLDTGATGLVLMGPSSRGLKDVAGPGQKRFSGAGSNGPVDLDARGVPVVTTQVGGLRIERPVEAQWVASTRPTHRVAEQMPGLLGYELLRSHRLVIDYPKKRFALRPSQEAVDPVDVHQWYIDRGGARGDEVERVRSLFVLGKTDEGRARLERIADRRRADPGAVTMLARIERREGKVHVAADRLSRLAVRDLIDTGEINASVNSLWLAGNREAAIEQATMATVLQPDSPLAWLSLADAEVASGNPGKARRAMQRVIDIEANPSAHLIRRGVIALVDGDVDGALARLRDHIRQDPSDGYGHWLYAQVAQGEERRAMAMADLEAIDDGVESAQAPFDFLAAAWRVLGDSRRASEHYMAGLERDCSRARSEASRFNCEAWYQAMVGSELDDAERKVSIALERYPGRAEFLDTLAVVRGAAGNATGARDASWEAARHSPDDVYLFTQAIRFEAALTED